jgi:hypothetical protein
VAVKRTPQGSLDCQWGCERAPYEIILGGYSVPRRANGLTTDRLKELARTGAATALNQLRAEIIAIERTFPELKLPATRRTVARSIRRVEQRGRQMSAAARKAVSARMKKYWAERRKAKAKVK